MVDEKSCLVCGGPAHGVHFQVDSCRACATFFRRSEGKKKTYKCRRASKNCSVAKDAPYTCRYCRLQKCLDVGMKMNDGPSSSTNKQHLLDTLPEPSTASSTTSSSVMSKISINNQKITYNGKSLIDEIKEILSGNKPKLCIPPKLSLIRNLQYAHRSLHVKARIEDLKEIQTISYFNTIEAFELILSNCAKLAMCCDEFAALEFSDKWLIYKHLWPLAQNVEMFYSTAELLGSNVSDFRCVLNNSLLFDMYDVTYTMPGASAEVEKNFNDAFKSFDDRLVKSLMIPIKELRLTEFEFAYLMAQCLWSVQGCSGISEQAIKVAEQALDDIADEIHNYYVQEMRMNNYSARLTRILKVLMECERNKWLQDGEFSVTNLFEDFKCLEIENGLL